MRTIQTDESGCIVLVYDAEDPREVVEALVASLGSSAVLARRVGVSTSLLSKIRAGERSVSRDLEGRLHDVYLSLAGEGRENGAPLLGAG